MTPQLAQLMNAAVARLAHAELALHALILSPERPVIATGDFSAALAAALGGLASALRTLRPVEPASRGTRSPRSPTASSRRQICSIRSCARICPRPGIELPGTPDQVSQASVNLAN